MESQIHAAPKSRRSLRGLGWVAIASLLAIGMLASSSGGSVVSAIAAVTSLHQTPPIASTDPEFQGTLEECAGEVIPAGQVLWHFVLTQTTAPLAGSLLHATFSGGGGDVDNWPAYKTSGGVLHWSIITVAGSLEGAHTNRAGRWLNLSHICQGATETTTTSTTTTTTTTSATTTTNETTQTATSTDPT